MEKKLVFITERQEDGTYVASYLYKEGNTSALITVDGLDFNSLRRRISEAVQDYIVNGYGDRFQWGANPTISLKYSEVLSNKPGSDNIIITGNPDGLSYRITNTSLGLDLSNDNFEGLRKQLLNELSRRGIDDKHIEFSLEEFLQLEPSSV